MAVAAAVRSCMPARARAEAQKGGFWSYIAGTAYRILVNHRIGGLVLDNYRTTLPMGKGLSSSAAICVLVSILLLHSGGRAHCLPTCCMPQSTPLPPLQAPCMQAQAHARKPTSA